jgi:hypothetical protein
MSLRSACKAAKLSYRNYGFFYTFGVTGVIRDNYPAAAGFNWWIPISKSVIWQHTAIFVIEDDAQDGCGPQKLRRPTTDTFGHSNRCAHHRPLSVRAEPNPFSSSH